MAEFNVVPQPCIAPDPTTPAFFGYTERTLFVDTSEKFLVFIRNVGRFDKKDIHPDDRGVPEYGKAKIRVGDVMLFYDKGYVSVDEEATPATARYDKVYARKGVMIKSIVPLMASNEAPGEVVIKFAQAKDRALSGYIGAATTLYRHSVPDAVVATWPVRVVSDNKSGETIVTTASGITSIAGIRPGMPWFSLDDTLQYRVISGNYVRPDYAFPAWWTEEGIAKYGHEVLRGAWVDDLRPLK